MECFGLNLDHTFKEKLFNKYKYKNNDSQHPMIMYRKALSTIAKVTQLQQQQYSPYTDNRKNESRFNRSVDLGNRSIELNKEQDKSLNTIEQSRGSTAMSQQFRGGIRHKKIQSQLYTSFQESLKNRLKNDSCKIKDLMYNCAEYEFGGHQPVNDINFRKNELDYPDYYDDRNIKNISQQFTKKQKANDTGIFHNQTYFMWQLQQSSKEEAQQLMKLLDILYKNMIDFRQLNNIRILFLDNDTQEKGLMNLQQFKDIVTSVNKNQWPAECMREFMNIIVKDDMAVFDKLSTIVDLYHYYPSRNFKSKNMSSEVYYIMSSNKNGQYSTAKDKKEEGEDRLGDIMDQFWAKVSSKFIKTANAFKFFDINHNGKVSFNEFRVGSENLGVKFTCKDLQQIFDYMDKNRDGVIDYYEFCNLTEEKRKNLDPFSSSGKSEVQIFERKKRLFDPQYFLGKNCNMVADKRDEINECASSELTKFKRRQLAKSFFQDTIRAQECIIRERINKRFDGDNEDSDSGKAQSQFQLTESSFGGESALKLTNKTRTFGKKIERHTEDMSDLMQNGYMQEYLGQAQVDNQKFQDKKKARVLKLRRNKAKGLESFYLRYQPGPSMQSTMNDSVLESRESRNRSIFTAPKQEISGGTLPSMADKLLLRRSINARRETGGSAILIADETNSGHKRNSLAQIRPQTNQINAMRRSLVIKSKPNQSNQYVTLNEDYTNSRMNTADNLKTFDVKSDLRKSTMTNFRPNKASVDYTD